MTLTAVPRPEVRAYLDHATTSPLRPEVIEALSELLALPQADPGRPYREALVSRELIEDARSSVAQLVAVTPRQVIFTSSIAESVNTAIAGLADGGGVLAPATERKSVVDAAAQHGGLATVAVTDAGTVDLDLLDARLASGAATMLAISLANHETGVLDDVERLIASARAHSVLVHLDASSAVGHESVDLGALDPDAATISAELIGGPLGTSALIVRKGRPFDALVVGGSQERGRRAGLENLLGIVGFGIASAVLTADCRTDEAAAALRHRKRLEAAALEVEGVAVVGQSSSRAPHLSCLTVAGVEAEPILLGLDREGIAVHSGSACASEALEPSPVLAAMGLDAARSLRLSVGWSTTDQEVDLFFDRFGPVVERLRALRA